LRYNKCMLEIVKSFLQSDAPRQSGVLRGQYYERVGSCNQCGKCCTNIYLVHGDRTIDNLPLFEELKGGNPEYHYFEPIIDEQDGSLVFRCSHLQPDNTCGIYENRPDFCRRYPSEQGLLMGGKLAAGCGYQFRLLKTFRDVLGDLLAAG
jgi:hypothetical protein